MKIVLNKEYGGFSLSLPQAEAYGMKPDDVPTHFGGERWIDVKPDGTHFDREDPKLVEVVQMGLEDAFASKLVIVEIPDGAYYNITEYDGFETLTWSTQPLHFV